MIRNIGHYCKEGVGGRWPRLSPAALMILCDVILYCDTYGIPCMITDTVTTQEEDDRLKRVSSTHRTCRAFDISMRGWTDAQAEECARHFSEKYKLIAAADTGGNRKLVHIHDAGTGRHLHFQVNREFAL